MTGIDWALLRAEAVTAMRKAYAPYSDYPVGCAAVTSDGRIVSGCNVENCSYGLTLCAECGLVSALAAAGGGRLAAFTCVNGDEKVVLPCGRCRQLLAEHGGRELLVETPDGIMSLGDLLPFLVGPGLPRETLTAFQA